MTELMYVLVADDDRNVRRSVTLLLQRMDRQILVVEAASAEAAIAALKQEEISLVVTDYDFRTGGSTGLQVMEVAGECQPPVRTILCSGESTVPDGRSFEDICQNGRNGTRTYFHQKPVKHSVLRITIENFLFGAWEEARQQR
jgi:DNA-binding NtrC family response regulator